MGNILNAARPDPVKVEMASKFVKEAIAKDKVVIFSKTYCPYCTMAKEVSQFNFIQQQKMSAIQFIIPIKKKLENDLWRIKTWSNTSILRLKTSMHSWFPFNFQQFQKLKEEFTTYELDKRDDGGEIQAALGEVTGGTTVCTDIYWLKMHLIYWCFRFNLGAPRVCQWKIHWRWNWCKETERNRSIEATFINTTHAHQWNALV